MSLIFWPSSHESQSCLSHYILGSFFLATLAVPKTSVLELSNFYLMFVSFFFPILFLKSISFLFKRTIITHKSMNHNLQPWSLIWVQSHSAPVYWASSLGCLHCRLASSERSLRTFSLTSFVLTFPLSRMLPLSI